MSEYIRIIDNSCIEHDLILFSIITYTTLRSDNILV